MPGLCMSLPFSSGKALLTASPLGC